MARRTGKKSQPPRDPSRFDRILLPIVVLVGAGVFVLVVLALTGAH